VEYRRLGRAGLKVSVLSYGSWVTFSDQMGEAETRECLAIARAAGVNLFDTAEVYGRGRSEWMLGIAIAQLGWDRSTFVLSTKLYGGTSDGVNRSNTLNRKYLLQAIDGCLERLRTSFVDLLYCHRPDPETPIEETVWAMSDIIASGKALYWGTSGWSAQQIREAWTIAERYSLRKPSMEQREYNLFQRSRVEECSSLQAELGLGLTTWSPLASGVLTGKYHRGVPPGSRASLAGYGLLRESVVDPERNRQVLGLAGIAHDLGCSTAQLAIAWCTMHPAVASVTVGASGPEQLDHNLRAVDVVPLLTPPVMARIDDAFR